MSLLGWPVWAFVVMGLAELAVPVWAEARGAHAVAPASTSPSATASSPSSCSARPSSSSSIAFQAVVDDRNADATVVLTAVGGLLTVFSMWWIYFAKPAAESLVSTRVAFLWGYGHYVVFAAAAAVGAGIAVMVDQATHESDLSRVVAGATITVPVAVYLLAVWFLHVRPNEDPPLRGTLLPIGAVVVLLMTFTGQPVVATGSSSPSWSRSRWSSARAASARSSSSGTTAREPAARLTSRTREPEPALRDEVALDLRGAAGQRAAGREPVAVLEEALDVAHVVGLLHQTLRAPRGRAPNSRRA